MAEHKDVAPATDHTALRAALVHHRRGQRILRIYLIGFLVALCLLAGQLWRVAHQEGQRSRDLESAVTANSQALQKANQRLRAAGKPTVAVPSGSEGPQGPQGPGPSAEQVQVAVDAYCGTGVCDGRNPTRSQVAAAVATYCDGRGDCAGAIGPTGATGPAVSADQVASAVATYCDAHGQCQGPAGSDGSQGPAGKDGQNAYPFTFTFTVQLNPIQSRTFTCTISAAQVVADPPQPAICAQASPSASPSP